MTTSKLPRALALAAGAVALVVAACGPSGSTAPTSGAVATNAPATQAPVATPGGPTDGGLPTFVLPSFNADVDLEALLPDELGGTATQKFSMAGDSFMGTGGQGSEELNAVLGQFGKSVADLSVGFAGTDKIVVIAYQIEGVPASVVFPAFLAAAQQDAEVTITDVTIGGKAVKKAVSADSEMGTTYVYASGDVLFIVGGDGVSEALLTEAFQKLP